MGRFIKSGPGWRLGWDSNGGEFQGLVGSDTWSLELSATELQDFCRLVAQLAATMAQMQSELMDEEAIAIEAETDRLWLEATGYPHAYRLHLILHTGRRGEGYWEAGAIVDLVQATQSIELF
jgi:hypothetical protein